MNNKEKFIAVGIVSYGDKRCLGVGFVNIDYFGNFEDFKYRKHVQRVSYLMKFILYKRK